MKSIWLRLHLDIRHDPKLTCLSPADRWYYVALLTMKADGTLDQFSGDTLSKVVRTQLRLTPEEAGETKERLKEVQLIDDSWQPTGWDARQYLDIPKEDSTHAERQRRYRERQRDAKSDAVTPVTVTPVTSVSVSDSESGLSLLSNIYNTSEAEKRIIVLAYKEFFKKHYPRGQYRYERDMRTLDIFIEKAILDEDNPVRIAIGVLKYKRWLRNKGKEGTEYVAKPSKWLEDRGWLEVYDIKGQESSITEDEERRAKEYMDNLMKEIASEG